MILQGRKTATRRIWKRNNANVGAVHKIRTDYSKRYYGKIKITGRYSQRLGDMTEEDALKEGGYSLKEFKEVWIKINGSWDDEQVVEVVEFKLVEGTEGMPRFD